MLFKDRYLSTAERQFISTHIVFIPLLRMHACDLNDDGSIDIFDVVKMVDLYGTVGTPINKTALLLELQDRMLTVEERTDSFRIITFFTPNETTVESGEPLYTNIASFEWVPQNASNNAILSINVYFRFRVETLPAHSIRLVGGVLVNNERTSSDFMHAFQDTL